MSRTVILTASLAAFFIGCASDDADCSNRACETELSGLEVDADRRAGDGCDGLREAIDAVSESCAVAIDRVIWECREAVDGLAERCDQTLDRYDRAIAEARSELHDLRDLHARAVDAGDRVAARRIANAIADVEEDLRILASDVDAVERQCAASEDDLAERCGSALGDLDDRCDAALGDLREDARECADGEGR